ncbi:MAG: ESX secretion-associated protein EspG [Pseudonocardiaceae bacterium]|nr:ESX secretion-associated protein EspG [Pseudonocardiaceae bacterium]
MTRFDLSATELDVVWQAAGFGALPLVIDVPSPGATHADRAALERRVWTDLVARDLAEDHGHAHWLLADLLGVLAHRGQSYQLRVFGDDATRAIIATRGRHTVLGVLADRFRLTSVPGVGRAAALAALLPDVPAGRGHSVSVDTTAFAAATRATSAARAHDRLRVHGLSADDARTLLTMTTGSVRTAQLVAERRDPGGRTVRSRPVSAHDTSAGRYRTIRTITAATDHLTVTPTTTAALVDALTRLTTAP